jgi:hypothetical protein
MEVGDPRTTNMIEESGLRSSVIGFRFLVFSFRSKDIDFRIQIYIIYSVGLLSY